MNSELRTRQEQIDRQLGRAGWAVGSSQVSEEFLVETVQGIRETPGGYRKVKEFADYALLDRLGRPLAVVEAKRSSRDPLEGELQAADYADALSAKHGVDPFIFLANGSPSALPIIDRWSKATSMFFRLLTSAVDPGVGNSGRLYFLG